MSAVSLAACGVIDGVGGSGASASPEEGDDITVGLLLPEVARYQQVDYPVIKQQVLSLTHNKGKVLYANAEADAARQSKQLDEMIAKKVDVLLVGPVADSEAIAPGIRKAKDAGIPVIAYDRLPLAPIDGYISFDKEFLGVLQGHSLLDTLGSKAAKSKIVMLNGQAADPNAVLFKRGALGELKGNVNIVKSYDIEGWTAENAKKAMEQAIQAVGPGNIAGVYAANDVIAGGAIDALKEAGVNKVPPVTGGNADLAAVQRIVTGDQFMSVYKPFPQEAADAAQMAVAKAQGKSIEFGALTRDTVDNPAEKNIPSRLESAVALTKGNIKDTVIEDGIYTVEDICTTRYEAECAAIGLK